MRKSSGIVALLGLLSTALFAACHPVLGKPAIVGDRLYVAYREHVLMLNADFRRMWVPPARVEAVHVEAVAQ